jgi:hypothetical protein
VDPQSQNRRWPVCFRKLSPEFCASLTSSEKVLNSGGGGLKSFWDALKTLFDDDQTNQNKPLVTIVGKLQIRMLAVSATGQAVNRQYFDRKVTNIEGARKHVMKCYRKLFRRTVDFSFLFNSLCICIN